MSVASTSAASIESSSAASLNMPARITVVGEAMLELSHHSEGDTVRLSYGGDTANTAVYLARLGCRPGYVTALGADPYSDRLLNQLVDEGVDTEHILRHPSRMTGLYAIQTDYDGERQFFYWREQSAARELFNLLGIDQALESAASSDYLYLSGITLSIYSVTEQQQLIDLAAAVKQAGGCVLFDPNYRPKGWPNRQAAQLAMRAIAPFITVVLPTLDDEHLLEGEAPTQRHASRWLDLGVETVVIKDGAQGAFVYTGSSQHFAVPTPEKLTAVDTTGAGDSFNAAFLAAYAKGIALEACVSAGHKLAAQVIQYRGGIIPLNKMPS